MRGYWLKIVLGAGVIGLVGIGIVRVFQSGVRTTRIVVETAEPISIPLAFIPFNLDGSKAGSVQRLRILRSAPETITGFEIRVEVADLPTYERLSSGCVLSVDNPRHLSTSSSFACGEADSGLVKFGSVEVQLAEGSSSRMSVPLYLPAALVAEFQATPADSGTMIPAAVNADSFARAMRQMADSIKVQTRALADSIRRQAAARVPPE